MPLEDGHGGVSGNERIALLPNDQRSPSSGAPKEGRESERQSAGDAASHVGILACAMDILIEEFEDISCPGW
jgi:hypothetical protein